jgi:hypothetical protein
MVTDFAAFYSARSRAVGFAEYIVDRSARAVTASVSGPRTFPDNVDSDGDLASTMYAEEMYLHEYISGVRWLEYQYWFGTNEYGDAWSASAEAPRTYLRQADEPVGNGLVESRVSFYDYPFPLFDLMDPRRAWFENTEKAPNITGTCRIMNYADYYLE